MHAVCLVGSARKNGNTAALASMFRDGLVAGGATASLHRLGDLRYSGCIGCFGCKTKSDRCVLKDDLAPVLDEVREADILALATPVYWGDVSSQLKGFIDRCFSFLVADYPTKKERTRLTPGKSMVMLIAQGHPKAQLFADIFPRYESLFGRYLGFSRSYLLRALGVYDPGAAAAIDELRVEAETLARRVLAGE